MYRSLIGFFFTLVLTCTPAVAGELVRLPLAKGSRASVSLSSPMLRTDASLEEVEGRLDYSPGKLEKAKLHLQGSSTALEFGEMPVEQMLLVQGLLRSLPVQQISFESTSFSRGNGGDWSIQGVARSGARRESLVVPARIDEVSTNHVRIRGVFSKTFSPGASTPPQFAMLGRILCEGKFLVEFRR